MLPPSQRLTDGVPCSRGKLLGEARFLISMSNRRLRGTRILNRHAILNGWMVLCLVVVPFLMGLIL